MKTSLQIIMITCTIIALEFLNVQVSKADDFSKAISTFESAGFIMESNWNYHEVYVDPLIWSKLPIKNKELIGDFKKLEFALSIAGDPAFNR